MYTENPPPTIILPSDEAQFEILAQPGWKADHVQLKLTKRCGNCYDPILRGVKAIVLSVADPEEYIKERGVSKGNAYRTVVYCNITCNRAAQLRILAVLNKREKTQ